MNIEANLTGIQDLKDLMQKHVKKSMIEAGEEAVKVAKSQKSTKDYMNHTWNLRNAPGFSVVMSGKEVHRDIPADSEHEKAKSETEKTLNKATKDGTGLILADGMYYASFVSAKGYDVLESAILTASKILDDKT